MILSGSTRGHSNSDSDELADHLEDELKNETVVIIDRKGVVSTKPKDCFREMRALGEASRASKVLYHMSVSLAAYEASTMTVEKWLYVIDEAEKELDLVDHQRVVFLHIKPDAEGVLREHAHVVWCRIHPLTLKCASDSHNYRKHEQVARKLEEHLGFQKVIGVHTRPKGTPRPVAIATHQDWQASERTGVKPQTVAKAIKEAWDQSANGKEFHQLIQKQGLKLCIGNRGFIVCDRAGTPHSISRRLKLKAKDVRLKLSDLNPNDFPTVEGFQQRIKQKTGEFKTMSQRANHQLTFSNQADPTKPYDIQKHLALLLSAGYDAYIMDNAIWFMFLGCLWKHEENKITICCYGEPTNEQVQALVTAGQNRGWKPIRFSGGSPEFQYRAREEAIKQGYKPEDIVLECEEGRENKGPKLELPDDMPDYLKDAMIRYKEGSSDDDVIQQPDYEEDNNYRGPVL